MHFSPASATFYGTPGKLSFSVSVSSSDLHMAHIGRPLNLTFNDLLHYHSSYCLD